MRVYLLGLQGFRGCLSGGGLPFWICRQVHLGFYMVRESYVTLAAYKGG